MLGLVWLSMKTHLKEKDCFGYCIFPNLFVMSGNTIHLFIAFGFAKCFLAISLPFFLGQNSFLHNLTYLFPMSLFSPSTGFFFPGPHYQDLFFFFFIFPTVTDSKCLLLISQSFLTDSFLSTWCSPYCPWSPEEDHPAVTSGSRKSFFLALHSYSYPV